MALSSRLGPMARRPRGRKDVACAFVSSVDMSRRRLQIYYSGRVQGVGFRYTVKAVAPGFEVTGTVRNLGDGRVELAAEGEPEELEAFRQAIRDAGMGGLIRQEEASWSDATGEFRGFDIIH